MNYKIILMSPLPPPYGGIGKWADRFIQLSKQYDFEVFAIDETKKKDGHFFGKNSNISLFSQLKRNHRIWNELKTKISECGKDSIVHCCIPSFTLSMMREYKSLKIAKRHGNKFVVHFRCTVPQISKSIFNKFFLKKFLKKADAIIVLNNKSADYLKDICEKQCNKIFVIPNFVMENEIKNINLHFNNHIKNALYVGGVVNEKGCDTILSVASNNKHITFNLIGNPSEAIINRIKQEKIDNVFLHGEQDKDYILNYVSNSDVFLFLSKYRAEGFSNALVEATGYGLPCIATDWATNKEQLGKYAEECIVNIDSPLQVQQALDNIDSIEKRKEISEYNIKHTIDFFSEKVVMKQYVDVYKKISK